MNIFYYHQLSEQSKEDIKKEKSTVSKKNIEKENTPPPEVESPTLPPDNLPIDSSNPVPPNDSIDKKEFAKNPIDKISKIVQLKSIFTKLISIKDLLQNYNDKRLDKYKDDIIEAINLFSDILLPNLATYKDKLSDIIKKYKDLIITTVNDTKKIIDSIDKEK